MLYVDVNLGNSGSQRIVIYENDKAEDVAEEFAKKHGLDDNMKEKLTKMLIQQIQGVLSKIDEEDKSQNSDT